MNYYHTGAIGDLICCMFAIKQAGGGALYLTRDNQRPGGETPNPLIFHDCVISLCNRQKYIDSVHLATDFAETPEPKRNVSAYGAPVADMRQQCTDLGVGFPGFGPWLEVDPWNPFGEPFVVINRTFRYRKDPSWDEILAGRKERLVFVGHQDEWSDFSSRCRLRVTWVPTENMHAAARLIAASEAFYGNPSACLHIAQGLGKEYWLEDTTAHVRTGLTNEHLI